MAIYRVGDEGATVFSVKGEPVVRLVAGQVVVPGSIDTPGSLADQHRKLLQKERHGKRLQGYENKVIRPAEDKSL